MRFIYIFLFTIVFSSCSTGASLRTARTLDQGQTELTAGGVVNVNCLGFVWANPVVHVAHGLTDELELEAHYEGQYISVLPRYQLLNSSADHFLDCTALAELGYAEAGHFLVGGGLAVGHCFHSFEPYMNLHYRYIFQRSKDRDYPQKSFLDDFLDELFWYGHSVHLKFGGRYLFSNDWFIAAEAGPSWVQAGLVNGEAAIGIGLLF